MIKCFKSSHSWVPFLFIFLLATTMAWPLFQGKIIFLADGPYAFIKAVAMGEAWRHGDFVGRWTPDVIHGYGYPMFNFYAPLFSYATALLMLLSIPAIWAFNICIYLALLFSGITMYLFAKEIWGRQGGIVAAVAYLLAPYHILDLYARGSLAEFTAFVFFPLVLRAIFRLMQKACLSDLLIGILSMAALVLSHNISALFYCGFSFCYLILIFLIDPQRKLSKLIASLSIFVGGALLTMYFWLPAMIEKKYVQIDRLLTGIYDYHRNFISISQLIMPSWPKTGDQLSFMMGPMHLLLLSLVLLLSFKIVSSYKALSRELTFFTAMLGVSIFLTLAVSQPIWTALPLLAFAEFPWRFLMCSTAASSILIGAFILLFKESSRELVMWVVAALLIASSIFSWHSFGYQDIHYTTAQEYLRASYPMDNMEYMPKTVSQLIMTAPIPKLQPLSPQVSIRQTQEKYLDNYFQIYSENTGVLCYHTYNFPGWKVEVNQNLVPIKENPWGLIVFEVPAGISQVRVYLTKTNLEQLSETVSKVSLIFLILIFLFYRPLNRLLFNVSSI